jgi:hypothetical protein
VTRIAPSHAAPASAIGKIGVQEVVQRRSRLDRGTSSQRHLPRAVREEDPAVGTAEDDAVLEMVHGRPDLRPLVEELRPVRLDLLAEELELVREPAELVGGAGAAPDVELAVSEPLHVLGQPANGLQGERGEGEGDEEGGREGDDAEGQRLPEHVVELASEKRHRDPEPDGGEGCAAQIEGEGDLVDLTPRGEDRARARGGRLA